MSAPEFEVALAAYKAAAIVARKAEEAYRVAHARALLASESKNEAARKADADTATTVQREARDLAQVECDCALHVVQYIKARAGVAA